MHFACHFPKLDPEPARGDKPATYRAIAKQLHSIIMTQKELATRLKALTAKDGKIAAEQATRFDKLSADFQALKDSINSGDAPVSQDVADNLTELETSMQALDDTIPDPPAA